MCIVVDACVSYHLTNRTGDGKPVLRWLLDKSKRSGLVLGGAPKKELGGTEILAVITELSRAGRVHSVNDQKVNEATKPLISNKSCKSNDRRIVALCMVSGCSIVFSTDQGLHVDLKELGRKSGKKVVIYKDRSHTHLLTECNCSAVR
jgi:hypothetical protein